MYFFFFSSRRRHTRFKCDWSSDVCSSDLLARPKYRSNTSQPFRTTSKPPFCVQRWVKSQACSSRRKSIPARSRVCAALVALRQPPEASGGGKYVSAALLWSGEPSAEQDEIEVRRRQAKVKTGWFGRLIDTSRLD